MYTPPIFREERLETLHALIRNQPLGSLVTGGQAGLLANTVPFFLAEAGPLGTLRAHLSKANDQLPALQGGGEALVLFQGPQAYVTPSWYPSKAAGGKVVPTWNYAVVTVRGTPRVIEDAAWLRAQLAALTDEQERSRAAPWHVSDAPGAFLDTLLGGIVGLEIPVAAIEGKWKVSQNRGEADRHGVAAGLRRDGGQEALARLVDGQR